MLFTPPSSQNRVERLQKVPEVFENKAIRITNIAVIKTNTLPQKTLQFSDSDDDGRVTLVEDQVTTNQSS